MRKSPLFSVISTDDDKKELPTENLLKMKNDNRKRKMRRKPIMTALFGQENSGLDITKKDLRDAFWKRKNYLRDLRKPFKSKY